MERVAFGITTPQYNHTAPFHPDTAWPELSFTETSVEPNYPYRLLRELFCRHGYDAGHFGTPDWNPLGWLIRPGQTVLLKPNFVLSFNVSGGDLFAVVTHPSVLRAVMDYVYIALQGRGRLLIADAPDMGCNWEQLMAAQRLDSIQEFYRQRLGFPIEVHDLRNFALRDPFMPGYSHNRQPLPGDPAGSVVINLDRRSAFYGLPSQNYYGADFDRQETIRHHHGDVHEYCVSRTALQADVLIAVPKMKVHKKVGVTLTLKGMVGINTNKNYLIHHRVGSPREGGDQLPDELPSSDRLIKKTQRWLWDHALARQSRLGDLAYYTARAAYRGLVKPFRPVSDSTNLYDGGNWHGNDTAWRMAADLAKIVFFADAAGTLHTTPQRQFYCVVDGIIGGENAGPLAPDPKPAGCLVAGQNPLAVDLVTTQLMGFDIAKLRQFDVLQTADFGLRTIADVEVLGPAGTRLNFKPHPGWVGHIEAA
jgi:uncharacterized protein (DUF362 family)